MRGWKVLVVWKSGRQEYVARGQSDDDAVFRTRREAQEMADSFREGIGSDAQSIGVVRA